MLGSCSPCGFGNSRLTYRNAMKECIVVDICWDLNRSLEVFQEEGYSPRDVTGTNPLALDIQEQSRLQKETDPRSRDRPTALY